MSDQTRYPNQRGSSPQARPGSEGRFSSRRAEDPLAELARLIGQDDPFADMGGTPQRAVPARAPQPRQPQNGNATNGAYARPAPRRDDRYEADEDYEQTTDGYAEPRNSAYARQQYDDAGFDDYEAPAQPKRISPPANGRAYSYGGAPVRAEPQQARTPVVRQPLRQQPQPEPEYYEDDHYDQNSYEQEPVNGHDASYRQARAPQPQQYDDQAYEQYDDQAQYEEDYIDDPYAQEYQPEPRRNWKLIGIAGAIGGVVLLLAGVYGYRAIFKKHASANPPTIQSTDAPSKVVPSGQASADGQKRDYDRISDQSGGGERVVSREEQPADLSSNANGSAPSGQMPPNGPIAFAAPPTANAASVLNPPAGSSVNRPSGEPKKVRTLSVRSDGSVADGPRPAAVPQRNSNAPLALNPQQADAQDSQDDPDAAPAVTAPTARNTRTASAPPQQNYQTSNYAPAGSYVVQVSSQKSQQDAQTAWQQLQAKYTNVLGNAQVNFKRVDLGDRGTFYRAMVGPFANRDQAYEMCQNLKAAGGECVVQRN